MRSQHKFVITAGLLCHLFVTAPLVTSQATAEQAVQNPGAPVEQAAPSPTPAEAPDTAVAKERTGNCHSVITAAPAVRQVSPSSPAKPNESAAAPAPGVRKPRIPVSEEHPVIID